MLYVLQVKSRSKHRARLSRTNMPNIFTLTWQFDCFKQA